MNRLTMRNLVKCMSDTLAQMKLSSSIVVEIGRVLIGRDLMVVVLAMDMLY